jgi:hypothetical protein
MFDLHLCLSTNVNVRSILHTQPLGLHNKILVWVSLYLSLLDYPSHLFHLLLPLRAIILPSLAFLFSIPSIPTLLMAKVGNCNTDGHGNNNTRNDASRHWTNVLRSNVTPLEPCKLDIVSTGNNPWVIWDTLIGIPLVLIHHPHSEGPKPLLTRGATTKLLWKLYTVPSQEGLC